MILRITRRLATYLVLFGLGMLSGLPVYAQHKTACELLPKADVEAILGVTLLPPRASAPFRSLLDNADFITGTPDQSCYFYDYEYSYLTPKAPKPAKVVAFNFEVRYAATPDAHAVEEVHKQVDTRTYDHPTDLPGLGDAAFWTGAPNYVTLFVFLGGTTRLMIGPSDIGLEAEKALAVKALAGLGKSSFAYGTQPAGLTKPVLSKPTANPSALEQLKRALTVKADAGEVKAQRALAGLYQSGTLAPDGSAQHDYAGAAYWYHQASVHGDAQAAYELAVLYRNGLGVPADAAQSFQLLEKAAEANYVPAMPLLSDAYASQKTPVSGQRATYWATKAAEAGDPRGWLILGFEYNTGKLGGDQVTWYPRALAAYRKAADGGNCVAMMAIGDLYANGQGVPADQTQAQSWHARAQACQGGNIAMLQAQVAQYKAKAAAARDPALYPMFSAIPVMPQSGADAAGNGNRSGPAVNSKIVAGLVAGAVIAAAIIALTPSSKNASSNSDDAVGDNLNLITEMNERTQALANCNVAGGTFVMGTGCL